MATVTSIPNNSASILVPFQITGNGGVARAVGEPAVIKQHLISTLMTNHYERVRFPKFGSNIVGRLFDPKDDLETKDAEDAIRESLINISTQLDISGVRIYDDPQDMAAVYVEVKYAINNQSTLLTVKLLNGIVTDEDLVS